MDVIMSRRKFEIIWSERTHKGSGLSPEEDSLSLLSNPVQEY